MSVGTGNYSSKYKKIWPYINKKDDIQAFIFLGKWKESVLL